MKRACPVTGNLSASKETPMKKSVLWLASWFVFFLSMGFGRSGFAEDVSQLTDLVQKMQKQMETQNKMMEGMRLSYRHGAASLLELLAAQRSADDAYLAYLQAKADLASATVQLQLSTGRKPRL